MVHCNYCHQHSMNIIEVDRNLFFQSSLVNRKLRNYRYDLWKSKRDGNPPTRISFHARNTHPLSIWIPCSWYWGRSCTKVLSNLAWIEYQAVGANLARAAVQPPRGGQATWRAIKSRHDGILRIILSGERVPPGELWPHILSPNVSWQGFVVDRFVGFRLLL